MLSNGAVRRGQSVRSEQAGSGGDDPAVGRSGAGGALQLDAPRLGGHARRAHRHARLPPPHGLETALAGAGRRHHRLARPRRKRQEATLRTLFPGYMYTF